MYIEHIFGVYGLVLFVFLVILILFLFIFVAFCCILKKSLNPIVLCIMYDLAMYLKLCSYA